MKTLTVQQKNYLTKRIDSITSEKIKEIELEYSGKINYRSGDSTSLDIEAAEGILAGKVPLTSHENLLKNLAKQVAKAKEKKIEAEAAKATGRYYGYGRCSISFGTYDLVKRADVKKYLEKNNAEARKLDLEKKKRCAAVMAESTKVKDKVILEGSEAAVKLLDEFANKKF